MHLHYTHTYHTIPYIAILHDVALHWIALHTHTRYWICLCFACSLVIRRDPLFEIEQNQQKRHWVCCKEGVKYLSWNFRISRSFTTSESIWTDWMLKFWYCSTWSHARTCYRLAGRVAMVRVNDGPALVAQGGNIRRCPWRDISAFLQLHLPKMCW